MQDKIKQLVNGLQNGDQRSLARAITLVENEAAGYRLLLEELNFFTKAVVIGVTGPPGAGKSTLVNALLDYWTTKDKSVAVIAVDPTSPFNFGALLGDRIRMGGFYNHPNVFIRSLATRGALGGLSAKIIEITDVVRNAPFDYIVVETVGVGQSEVEVAGLADCTIVALVPEAGDEVQTLKAGIMEIANIFVVNKADREAADAIYRSLRILAREQSRKQDNLSIPVVKTIATRMEGIAELADCIEHWLIENSGRSTARRTRLMADKAWRLIQQRRMHNIQKANLEASLEEAMQKETFNLYSFTKAYDQANQPITTE